MQAFPPQFMSASENKNFLVVPARKQYSHANFTKEKYFTNIKNMLHHIKRATLFSLHHVPTARMRKVKKRGEPYIEMHWGYWLILLNDGIHITNKEWKFTAMYGSTFT